jgi:5-methylcytosine-specific restriction endonuclease McrA
MAVSQRTRYEVFRRDNFQCRYCRTTERELTIDHVLPIALGGSDEPTNLVTACRDCNMGKGSTAPDSPVVADVEASALRWADAIAKAAEITDAQASVSEQLVEWFDDVWYTWAPNWAERPADAPESVIQFASLGLSRNALEEAVRIAASRRGVPQRDLWRYFCGVCWNKVRDLQNMADALLAAEDADGS